MDFFKLKNFNQDHIERRKIFLDFMKENGRKGVDCRNCSGVCCTFVSNSMKVTPVELVDFLYYLIYEINDATELKIKLSELLNHCDEVIKKYRLNIQIPGNGKKDFLRRTYTCPFFKDQKLGCLIHKDFRPYGCLGFNSHESGITDGQNCGIITSLHTDREEEFQEVENIKNEEIKKYFNLNFDKEYLPIALKEIITILLKTL